MKVIDCLYIARSDLTDLRILVNLLKMRVLSHPFISELKRYVANHNATLGPIVMTISELVGATNVQKQVYDRQKKLSEVTDMIHAAHVFHRCVRDRENQLETRDTAKRLHQDNILSVLVGDYLLAQSSVDMAELRFPKAVELIAIALENYTMGEFLKLELFKSKSDDINDGVKRYAELTCGSLLSNSCLSAALMAGLSEDVNKLVGSFGFHTGTAHRLIEILNCDDDKLFLQRVNISHIEESIVGHLNQSISLIHKLPHSEKRAYLLSTLNKMKPSLNSPQHRCTIH